jgi:hypothetical protein
MIQKEAWKKLVDWVREVLKNIDYSQPVDLYLLEVDKKIRALIQDSWIKNGEALEEEYKTFRRQLLAWIRDGDIRSFGDVSSFLAGFWMWEFPESLKIQEVIERELDEEFWNKSHIDQPLEWVIYRWGTARKILREYLWLQPNPADDGTDIDVYLSPELNVDNIRELLQCDAEGITQLDDFTNETIHQKCRHVDLWMNQILVTKDTIYYTKKSEDAARDGVTDILVEPDNLFGVKQYIDESWRVVFTNQKLYRVLSMLVRGKIKWVKIRQDNISSENADAIWWMDKYIIIVFKKILNETKGDLKNTAIMMYRYAGLLVRMWYIGAHNEIYGFIWDTHQNSPVKVYDSYLQKDFDDGWERDMLWRLDKMTRVLVRKIIPDTLSDYTFDPNDTEIELVVNEEWIEEFQNSFHNKWQELKSRIESQDSEK